MTQNESEQFAAVFVLRVSVANDPRIVVRLATYIFNALTADDAFSQAERFGPQLDYKYRNTAGDVVEIKCVGIHELDRVEPDTEDYPGLVSSSDFVAPNELDLSALATGRNDLACFNHHRDRQEYPNLNQ